jgi:hypothetical protein
VQELEVINREVLSLDGAPFGRLGSCIELQKVQKCDATSADKNSKFDFTNKKYWNRGMMNII